MIPMASFFAMGSHDVHSWILPQKKVADVIFLVHASGYSSSYVVYELSQGLIYTEKVCLLKRLFLISRWRGEDGILLYHLELEDSFLRHMKRKNTGRARNLNFTYKWSGESNPATLSNWDHLVARSTSKTNNNQRGLSVVDQDDSSNAGNHFFAMWDIPTWSLVCLETM